MLHYERYVCSMVGVCCFFFQAEDGIRDDLVTGVQTCALPISIRDCDTPCGGEQFDRPLVKCYKSAFCIPLCAPSSACFADGIWGSLGPARSDVFPVE